MGPILPDDVADHGIVPVLGQGQYAVDEAGFALELVLLPLVNDSPGEVGRIRESDRDRGIRGRLRGPGPDELTFLARVTRRGRGRRGAAGLGELAALGVVRRLLDLPEE